MTKDNLPMNEPGIVFDDDMVMTPDLVDIKDVKKTSHPSVKTDDEDIVLNQDDVELVMDMNPQSTELQDKADTVLSGELVNEKPYKESTSKDVAIGGAHGVAETNGRMRMGDKLVSMGLITEDQLNVALQEKKITGKMIGEVMVDLGFIDDETLSAFLAQSSGFTVFDPKATLIDGAALDLIDKQMALKHHVLPFSITDGELLVAMADPYDVVALDILKKHVPKKLKIKPSVSTPHIISEAIDAAYGYASSINAILKEIEDQDLNKMGDVAGLSEEEAYSHPLVRLVNALIFEAVKTGASDLHFEPEENFVRLRYRIDGVLSTVQILHKQHWNGISQRIKLMASLNIADKLAPQDGRIKMNVGGHEVDFRVSSLPTVFGENIVMRVLDKQASIMPLSSLGFSAVNKERIARAQKRPEGIIIVTGPTGSGKTTTLYSMLNEINSVDVNIQTLEDPVEYSLPMIRQTPIREGFLDFADGIRALLRQDPDIIFIGEIRDKTTAEMALQAAMTGHQVYTSLHTNDSFGALPRLFDLGMVPGMVAGNIVSIFAQRLARTLCPSCKQPHTATDEECKLLGVTDAPEIFKARQGGCDLCGGQGYKGRVAVAEVLLFDSEMDEIVARKGTKAELYEVAVAKGFKSMRDDAMLKILEGKTTFEAVSKVVDVS
ncbi:MAG: ATPase, T2SS/T4P/T4SS family [Alphaproteobacteria bacterium]|nr:ATPase, T2SS/T4P/T4SS family [Alphaproteobacteria bacterium]